MGKGGKGTVNHDDSDWIYSTGRETYSTFNRRRTDRRQWKKVNEAKGYSGRGPVQDVHNGSSSRNAKHNNKVAATREATQVVVERGSWSPRPTPLAPAPAADTLAGPPDLDLSADGEALSSLIEIGDDDSDDDDYEGVSSRGYSRRGRGSMSYRSKENRELVKAIAKRYLTAATANVKDPQPTTLREFVPGSLVESPTSILLILDVGNSSDEVDAMDIVSPLRLEELSSLSGESIKSETESEGDVDLFSNPKWRDLVVSAVMKVLFPSSSRSLNIFSRQCSDTEGDSENDALDSADRLGISGALMSSLFAHRLDFVCGDVSLDNPVGLVTKVMSRRVLHTLVDDMVYESPLQTSPRMRIIKALIGFNPVLSSTLCSALDASTQQYLERERGDCDTFGFSNSSRTTGSSADVPEVSKLANPLFQPAGSCTGLAHLFAYLIQVLREYIFCKDSTSVSQDGSGSVPHKIDALGDDSRMNAVGNDLHTLTRVFVTLIKCKDILGSNFDPLVTCAICMVRMHAAVPPTLYRQIVRVWPVGSSNKELLFIQLTERLLLATPPVMHHHPVMQGLYYKLFQRISSAITSPHNMIARQAIVTVSNMYLLMNYILTSPKISTLIKAALATSSDHWHHIIREMCNSQFERMLDLS